MEEPADDNAAIWKSDENIDRWSAETSDRERRRGMHWRTLATMLPFERTDAFTFVDLGAGTGAATRPILELYPQSRAILADFSPQMITAGERALAEFTGRFRYVEFDLSTSKWPGALDGGLELVVTSLAVHHLPDDRKQALFGEIFEHLAPGGWYLNYDPVTSADPIVEATWERVNDRLDPIEADKRRHRGDPGHEHEQQRHENHIRYMIPLEQQLGYLRAAGFAGIDVYWKHLENVIYGGCRPT